MVQASQSNVSALCVVCMSQVRSIRLCVCGLYVSGTLR